MTDAEYVAAFKKSYAELTSFLENWMSEIDARCKEGDPQRKAAYFAWARFSMSIRTLESLLHPALYPDVCVVCRGCIEFDITMAAVMKNREMADAYLEFAKHAKAKHLRLLAELGHVEQHIDLRAKFYEEYKVDIDGLGQRSWCDKWNGISGLIRKLDRLEDLRGYALLCHFAHGSIMAMAALDGGIDDPSASFVCALKSTYLRYLNSTREFLEFIWGPVATPENEKCKREFFDVLANYIKSTDA